MTETVQTEKEKNESSGSECESDESEDPELNEHLDTHCIRGVVRKKPPKNPRLPRRQAAFQLLQPVEVEMDPYVMRTIALQDFGRNLSDFLDERELGRHYESLDVLEIPQYPSKMRNPRELCRRRTFPPPHVSEGVAKQILRKSIATICSHSGFETAPEMVLDLLTDIAHERLKSTLDYLKTIEVKIEDRVFPNMDPAAILSSMISRNTIDIQLDFGHNTINIWYRLNVKLRMLEMEDHCEDLKERFNEMFPTIPFKRRKRNLPKQKKTIQDISEATIEELIDRIDEESFLINSESDASQVINILGEIPLGDENPQRLDRLEDQDNTGAPPGCSHWATNSKRL